jgi:hypothetical protein
VFEVIFNLVDFHSEFLFFDALKVQLLNISFEVFLPFGHLLPELILLVC